MNTAFRSRPARLLRAAGPLVVAAALLGAAGPALAGLKALRRVPVPLPPNLGAFVVNRDAAIQLGKALFWETQAGGDGVQACASCHFHASADDRTVNTVNPAQCTPQHSCGGHDKAHQHGPTCGHMAVPHGDHTDFLVNGHLHHPHGSHCDDHGAVKMA